MRPLGRPPMPSARSRPSEPVDTASISTTLPFSPSFITEPLPKARSICASAASSARFLSESSCPTSLNAAFATDGPLLPDDSANLIGFRPGADELGFVRSLFRTCQEQRWNVDAALGGPTSSNPRWSRHTRRMRPLRYSINVTLDGCCDHRAIIPDADLHRHATENLAQADALLFGRVTYEMMAAAWRPPAPLEARPDARPDWMEPFARTIDAAKKYVVSS